MNSMPILASAPASGATAADAGLAGLMARIVDGDRAAFARLVQALEGGGLRLADRTLTDRAGAEDVVQVALTRMWTMAARYDPARGSVEGWFRRIVVNLCLDRRRATKLVAPIEAAENVASSAPDPFQQAVMNDQRVRLAAAMTRLAPRQRAALAMFHGDGLSMAEIAVALETSPKAVEGLLGRARMELKALIGGSDAEMEPE
jgi:RNA polymerase sigma-70 factor (ECF subfamily)